MNGRLRQLFAVVFLLGAVVFVFLQLRGGHTHSVSTGPIPPDLAASGSIVPPSGNAKGQPSSTSIPPAEPVTTSTLAATDNSLPSPSRPNPGAPRLVLYGRITLPSGDPATSASLVVKGYKGPSRYDRSHIAAQSSVGPHGDYELSVADCPLVILSVNRPGSFGLEASVKEDDPAETDPTSPGIRRVRRDLVLRPAVSISGRVEDKNGKGIPGALLRAHYVDRWKEKGERGIDRIHEVTAGSDADGRYVIGALCPDYLSIEASAKGYHPSIQRIDAPATNVLFQLDEWHSLVSGHVYLHSTGEAVPDATVFLYAEKSPYTIPRALQSHKTHTNSYGEFAFTDIIAGGYRLEAKKDNLRLLTNGKDREGYYWVDLDENETSTGNELFLYRGHTIHGYVIDRNTRQPIPGAVLTASPTIDPSKARSVSDERGEYLIVGAYGPLFSLRIEKEGYDRPGAYSYHQVGFDLRPDNLHIESNIELERITFISGHIRDSFGSPVAHARVEAMSPAIPAFLHHSTKSDESGAYTLYISPFNAYRLMVVADGFPKEYSDVVRISDQPVTDFDIVLEPPASIQGVVVDDEDSPIDGAVVQPSQSIEWPNSPGQEGTFKETTTGVDGEFTLTGLPVHNLTLVASHNGVTADPVPITLSPGETKTGVRLVIRDASRTAYLGGHVYGLKSTPLSSVDVIVSVKLGQNQYAIRTQTDTEGHYRVEFKPGDSVELTLKAHWFRTIRTRISSFNRDDADFTLQPAPGFTATLYVVDWDTGARIPTSTVLCRNATLWQSPAASGRFVADNLLRDHEYNFLAKADGYVSDGVAVAVPQEGADSTEVTIALGHGGSVSGRIIDRATGKPLSGIRVSFKHVSTGIFSSPYSDPDRAAVSGGDGRFRMIQLPRGKGVVLVYAHKSRVDVFRQIQMEHGKDIDLGDIALGAKSP